jgi:DNA-binding transcriptional LysR family regulator
MNTAFLRYFLTAAEIGNFTRAAERLHVTQPTLSAGIARLEEMLGTRLLERGRHVRLTPAGSRFVPRAQAMLAEWQQAQAELRSEQPRQRLRLALGPALPTGPLERLLGQLHQAAPDIELELSEAIPAAAAARLAQKRLDAVLGELTGTWPDSDSLTLLREPYGIAIARHHALATRDRCRIADLASMTFVWRSHCEQQERARRAFAEHGLRPRIMLRTVSEERVAALVTAGLAAAFVPESLAQAGMAFVPLAELPLERRLGLAWHRDSKREAVALLRRLARELRWGGGPAALAPDPALAH